MSTELSLHLTDEQVVRLDRAAHKVTRSRTEAAEHLLEIALRQSEFPYVEFRDFGVGLEPFLRGTRLRICRIVTLADDYVGDVAKVAEHLDVTEREIKAALDYAAAFPDDIATDIAANDKGFEELKRILPNLEIFTVDVKADATAF